MNKENQTFTDIRPMWLHHRKVEGIDFHDCVFDNCIIPQTRDPNKRFQISNIALINCAQRACSVSTAVIEDVILDGLKRLGDIPFFVWGSVFKHVTLKGSLAMFKFNNAVTLNSLHSLQKLWDEDTLAYYRSVDWALDISEAQFNFCPDLHSIPGSLIRRDPRTQVLITHQHAKQALQSPALWGISALRNGADWFVSNGIFDDVVLVAATKARYFQQDLEVLDRLRSAGFTQ